MKRVSSKRASEFAELPAPLLSLIGSKCSTCGKKNLRATCKALHALVSPTSLELKAFSEFDELSLIKLAEARPNIRTARVCRHTDLDPACSWLQTATSCLSHWTQLQEIEIPALASMVSGVVKACNIIKLSLLPIRTVDEGYQSAQLNGCFSILNGWTCLQELRVLGQYVKTVSGFHLLCELVQLKSLQLSVGGVEISNQMDLTDMCRGLGRLSQLTSLTMHCVVLRPTCDFNLSPLTSLQSLSFHLHNPTSSLPPPQLVNSFAALSQLTCLEVGLVENIPANILERLKKLVHLNAPALRLDASTLVAMSACQNMSTLSVGRVLLEDQELGIVLPELKQLEVHRMFCCKGLISPMLPNLEVLMFSQGIGPCIFTGLYQHPALSRILLPYRLLANLASGVMAFSSMPSLAHIMVHVLDNTPLVRQPSFMTEQLHTTPEALPHLLQVKCLTVLGTVDAVNTQRMNALKSAMPYLKTLQLCCTDPNAGTVQCEDDEDDEEHLGQLALLIASMRSLQHVKIAVEVWVPFRVTQGEYIPTHGFQLTHLMRVLASNPVISRVSLTHTAEVPDLYVPGTAKHSWLQEVKRQIEDARLPQGRFIITFFD